MFVTEDDPRTASAPAFRAVRRDEVLAELRRRHGVEVADPVLVEPALDLGRPLVRARPVGEVIESVASYVCVEDPSTHATYAIRATR